MFGWKRKQTEPLPWYRAPKYKGNLTEDEKRELDSFRLREKKGQQHPTACFSDLPEEVQSYISKTRIELYDAIQERLVGRCTLVSAVGLFLLLNHFGWVSPKYDSTMALLFGALLLLAPWVYYSIKWKRNADQFTHDRYEGIRTEWELDYVVNKKMEKDSAL